MSRQLLLIIHLSLKCYHVFLMIFCATGTKLAFTIMKLAERVIILLSNVAKFLIHLDVSNLFSSSFAIKNRVKKIHQI